MKKIVFLAVAVLLVVGVGAGVWYVTQPNSQEDTVAESTQDKKAPTSAFSFNAGNAEGWRKGPSNTSSLALFNQDQSCFASLEKKGAAENGAEFSINTKAKLTADGYTVTDAGSLEVAIETNDGVKNYELMKYAVSGDGIAGKVYGGQAYGFIPIKASNISVTVNCNTIDELDSATAALKAVSYNEAI